MKYLSLCLMICFSASLSVHAQSFNSKKKGSLIGFSGNFTDFETPATFDRSGVGKAFAGEWAKISSMHPGFSLTYWQGLTNHLDVSGRYNMMLTDYHKGGRSAALTNEFEASGHLRALTDNHVVNPFLTAGIGVGNYGYRWAPYSPLGIGVQFNIQSQTYIFLQTNYRVSYKKTAADNNLFYSLGISESISKPKEKEIKQVPIPIVERQDRDNDGVVDSLDECPDAAGLANLNGCPDQDGDGISDKDDKCPDVKGTLKYQGCPIPDSDGDGINDEEDKCPNEKGVARYNGCPVPDQDNDGVDDENDKCPTVPGLKENNGCPEVKAEVIKKANFSAKQIFFATGSHTLLAKSFPSLNSIVEILKADENLKLDIEGHTDITGSAEKNLVLSEKRARSVADYLEKKGISSERLTAQGFGSEHPIADNKTVAGRNKNRRVELKLKY